MADAVPPKIVTARSQLSFSQTGTAGGDGKSSAGGAALPEKKYSDLIRGLLMSEEVGKRVGDYEILGELGSGGMGRVFKVRNVLSDRIEAMKVLLPDVATRQELAARFQREIKLLASLSHPNIAALRTALTIDNQLVMIMEYVEGTTLADRLAQGSIPPADSLKYIDQVLNALSYAHQQHIIHRDIKPANIILTPQGVIKVMDFGIARSGDERSLTMTGTTLGSLSYMSPEQVKGEATDARSDLYSVGITLYEMVTGQRPFQAHSDYSIMSAHVKEAPKAPIELTHGLPPALNDIILIAIAKDPTERFQTADAFRNALRSVQVAPGTSPAMAVAPAIGSDSAPTATLNVPAISAADQATVVAPAPAVAKAPTPTPLPPVTPIAPMMPPPSSSSHRGLYMTMGALVVLFVLVAAGIYVPRMSKTQATSSPSEPQPPAAVQTTPAGSQEADQQTPMTPSTVDSANSGTMAQPSAPAESVPTPASSSKPPAVPTPAQPHPGATAAAKTGGAQSGAGSMVPAGLREAEVPSHSKGGGAVSARATQAADAAAQSVNSPSSAVNLQQVQDEVDQLSNRAAAVDSSLDHLQQEQSNSGYGMRGDMVARRASMQSNLSKAEKAVQEKDSEKAQKYLGLAQGDVEALEHFLGH